MFSGPCTNTSCWLAQIKDSEAGTVLLTGDESKCIIVADRQTVTDRKFALTGVQAAH